MDIKTSEFGKTSVIKLVGEFYLSSIKNVESVWDQMVKKASTVIGIDCSELEFIDSSAIGTLVKLLNSSDKCSIKLVFYDLSDSVMKIFQTTKLNKIFTITTKEDFENQYIL